MSFFLAVDLSAPARAEVTALIDAHRTSLKAKWLRTDKLHITLHYLGHPSAEDRAALEPIVREAIRELASFELALASSGTFSTARAAGVLWLGVSGEVDRLRALHATLIRALGIETTTPYVPHLTLARSDDAAGLARLADSLRSFAGARFCVTRVTLFESQNDLYRAVFDAPLRSQASSDDSAAG